MNDSDLSDLVLVGYTDPTFSVQHVPILKNGTKYIAETVTRLNWKSRAVPINRKISRFIILRDPYERWLTAFTEDILTYIESREDIDERVFLENLFSKNDINWFLDFLIDRNILYFDTHAELQCKQIELVLHCIKMDKLTFIKMTDKLGQVINTWLHEEGVRNNFNNGKINVRDKNNDMIYKKIAAYFMDGKNLKKKEKVLEYLKPDYELINSVRFINPT